MWFLIVSLLSYGQSLSQNISLSSEYNQITWPVSLGVGGGLTGDDGQYKRLALFHGHSISLQTGSNTPSISNSRLYISNTGGVGIGTTNPEAHLHVVGSFRQGGTGVFNIDGPGVVGGRLSVLENGNVGIGTTNPGQFKLAVEGKIGAQEVEVRAPGQGWADFVFSEEYRLPPLQTVADYIAAHHHLPDVPSQAEVVARGYLLGEMDAKLLQKIEELTLYVLQQQQEINTLKHERQQAHRVKLITK